MGGCPARVSFHAASLSSGPVNEKEGAQGESKRRLIEAERLYTDEDDRRRDCAGEPRVRGFEREVEGRREKFRPHLARNPRRH
jgi:hypothetical protein